MLGKKQITAKNAKHTKENRGSFLAFLAVTMQFMGAMSDEGKQLRGIIRVRFCCNPPIKPNHRNLKVKR